MTERTETMRILEKTKTKDHMKNRMVKILFTMVITLVLVFSCNLISYAETQSGTSGSLTWTLDSEAMLTISGNGSMKGFSGDAEPLELEISSKELTWYIDLPKGNQSQMGSFSVESTGEMQVPWNVRDYNDFNTVWSLEYVSGPDNFSLDYDEAYHWSGDDYFRAAIKPKEGTLTAGDSVYLMKCAYKNNIYEGKVTIHSVSGAILPTQLNLRAFKTDASGSTIGQELSITNNEITVKAGECFYLSGNANGSIPGVNTEDVFLNITYYDDGYTIRNERWQGTIDTAKGIYGNNTALFTTKTPGTYRIEPWTDPANLSNFSVANPITLKITDENGNLPAPRLLNEPAEVTWYIGLPWGGPGKSGMYSLSAVGQLWFPDDLRDYSDLNITWNLKHESGPDNFVLYHHPDSNSPESYFNAMAAPKSDQLTPGDSLYTMQATYKDVTYEGILTIHTVNNGMPTGITFRVFEANGSDIGTEVLISDGTLFLESGKSYWFSGVFNGGTAAPNNQWINNSYYGNGIMRGNRWNKEAQPTYGIYSSNTELFTATAVGTYSAEADLSIGLSNLAWSMPITLKVTNGSQTETELILKGDYPWTNGGLDIIDYPVYIGLPLRGNVCQWDTVVKVFVSNYEEMAQRYGGYPNWSVTRTDQGTDELDFSWRTDDAFGERGRAIGELNSMPTKPMTAELTVTCEWGGKTASKVIRVQAIQLEDYPTGLDNLPDVIETQVGNTLTLAPTLLPAGWNKNGYTPRIFVANGLMEFADLISGVETGTTTVRKAGTYQDTVGLLVGTVFVIKPVTFQVEDGNGNVPATVPVIGTQYGLEWNYYIGTEFEERTIYAGKPQSETQLAWVFISNYDDCAKTLKGEPVFSIISNQATSNVYIEQTGNPNGISVDLKSIPTINTDVVYTVICEWDGTHTEQELTVHYVDTYANNLPTGIVMDFENPMTVKVGDRIDLNGKARFKNNWSIPGYGINVFLGGGSIWNGISWEEHNDVWGYYAKVPGTYEANVTVSSANIKWMEEFTLQITDENGNIPSPRMNDQEVTWYMGLPKQEGADSDVVYSVPTVAQIWLPNDVIDRKDKNVQWELIHQSGPDNFELEYDPWDWEDSYFFARAIPKNGIQLTPGTGIYTMRATYKGVVYEATLTIHTVALNQLPTGIACTVYETNESGTVIGDEVPIQNGVLTVKSGQNYYIQATLTGSIPETDISKYWINGFSRDGVVRKNRWEGQPDTERKIYRSNTEMFTAGSPGVYDWGATLSLELSNMEIRKDLTLQITDEQGNVPIPEPVFEGWFGLRDLDEDLNLTAEYFVSEQIGIETVSEKLYSTNHLFTWQISNMKEIEHTLTEAPRFEVTQTSGTVKFRTETYEDDYWGTAEIDVMMTELPAEGNAEFKATCTIGDKIYEQTVKFKFTRITSFPTGLEGNLSTPQIIKVGDAFPFDPGISFKDGWSVGGGCGALWGGDDDFFDAIAWKEPTHVEKSGVVDVPLVAFSANLYMEKTVRYIFTEADGTLAIEKYVPYGIAMKLPAGTKKIESEAFAGTIFREVDIPAGTEIADDAFKDSELVAVYTHNDPNIIQWAVQNNFVALVE